SLSTLSLTNDIKSNSSQINKMEHNIEIFIYSKIQKSQSVKSYIEIDGHRFRIDQFTDGRHMGRSRLIVNADWLRRFKNLYESAVAFDKGTVHNFLRKEMSALLGVLAK